MEGLCSFGPWGKPADFSGETVCGLSFVNRGRRCRVADKASRQAAGVFRKTVLSIPLKDFHMTKLLATLVASLFAASVFAQATPATPATPAAPAAAAKKEEKKAEAKK
jgi:hypothetical protein